MFNNKKILEEIKKTKNEIEKEKQELLAIKQYLEDNTPKIDISNIYVWLCDGIYNIVEMNVKNIKGTNIFGKEDFGYESTLTDIFTKKIIYKKTSLDLISRKEYVDYNDSCAYLYSLYEIDKDLMVYVDKKVPMYILQQLYYKLNQVDTNNYVLKKENK